MSDLPTFNDTIERILTSTRGEGNRPKIGWISGNGNATDDVLQSLFQAILFVDLALFSIDEFEDDKSMNEVEDIDQLKETRCVLVFLGLDDSPEFMSKLGRRLREVIAIPIIWIVSEGNKFALKFEELEDVVLVDGYLTNSTDDLFEEINHHLGR